MNLISIILSICLFATTVYGNPLLTSWEKTKAIGTGYNGITGGIQKIRNTSTDVYIYMSGVPQNSIGPWKNPNVPADQQFWFRFPLNPTVPAVKTTVPLGHIGVWKSGVTIYNADDGQSYNNQGIWKRNAYYWEGVIGKSFDSCNGHADAKKEYHIHINPACQYTISSSIHSPLLGFSFDGYPIYGPYGYSVATDSKSSIKRILSSYKLRSITKRQILANGTQLAASQYGPDVSSSYPLGSFLDDYQYVKSSGDLDQYNGRFSITPEYPKGIYCYFVTINSDGSPAYPFILGPQFYGAPVKTNMGPGSGKTYAPSNAYNYFTF